MDTQFLTWLLNTLKSPDVIAALVTLVSGLYLYFFPPTAKIIWGTTHRFTFTLPQVQSATPGTLAYTSTVIVQNNGRMSADGVEIHFNYKPQHFQVWPTFQYETAENPEHRFVVVIKSLGRREYATLELFSVGQQLPDILRVRSSTGQALEVPTRVMRVWSRWVYLSSSILLLLGVFEILQLLAHRLF